MYKQKVPLLVVSAVAVSGMTKSLLQTYTIKQVPPAMTEQKNQPYSGSKTGRWRSFFVGVLGFFWAAQQVVRHRLDDALLVVDRNGRIVAANLTMKALLPAGWLFQPLTTVCPDIMIDMQSPPTTPIEVKIDKRFYRATAIPFCTWRQRPLGCALRLHDITTKKAQLNQQREMMQSMIHDLRSPLTNTLSALQMFQEDGGDLTESTNQMLLEMMVCNTEQTLAMVDSLLDIERLASGKEIPLQRTAVAMPAVVDKMLQAQMARARQKNITLHNDLPATLPLVYGNAKLLERIIQNLVDNGVKFGTEGSEIRITSRRLDQEWLEFSVVDNGPGIATEQLDVIFDKFVTGELPSSGVGIGLAFCQAAVMAHKGRIWVESDLGEGSRFCFTLPLAS